MYDKSTTNASWSSSHQVHKKGRFFSYIVYLLIYIIKKYIKLAIFVINKLLNIGINHSNQTDGISSNDYGEDQNQYDMFHDYQCDHYYDDQYDHALDNNYNNSLYEFDENTQYDQCQAGEIDLVETCCELNSIHEEPSHFSDSICHDNYDLCDIEPISFMCSLATRNTHSLLNVQPKMILFGISIGLFVICAFYMNNHFSYQLRKIINLVKYNLTILWEKCCKKCKPSCAQHDDSSTNHNADNSQDCDKTSVCASCYSQSCNTLDVDTCDVDTCDVDAGSVDTGSVDACSVDVDVDGDVNACDVDKGNCTDTYYAENTSPCLNAAYKHLMEDESDFV